MVYLTFCELDWAEDYLEIQRRGFQGGLSWDNKRNSKIVRNITVKILFATSMLHGPQYMIYKIMFSIISSLFLSPEISPLNEHYSLFIVSNKNMPGNKEQ